MPTGSRMHGCPAMKPMGLVAWMMLPVRSAGWVNWACWPSLSVNVYGTLAGPAGSAPPPATAVEGSMVTWVPSSAAMMFIDGAEMSVGRRGDGHVVVVPDAGGEEERRARDLASPPP